MLEVIRALPKDSIQEIHLVYFEGENSNELLPEFDGQIIHHLVPGKVLFPFLLKSIFYQIWCFFFIRFCLSKDVVKIGIGTACLGVDLCNIQFIQTQWEPLYFRNKPFFSYKTIYKRFLFLYFKLCENYLFRKEGVKFLSLSHFISEYLKQKFQVQDHQIRTEYSSVNLEHFPLPSIEKKEILKDLVSEFNILCEVNINEPLFLFVGAFERKGLEEALSLLSTLEKSQIIIIGKGEHSNTPPVQKGVKTFYIPFTKRIELFYQLSDCFIFPTIYEPFGLVIAEAAAMGNNIITYRKNVGASEILECLPSIRFLDFGPKVELDDQLLSSSKRLKNAINVRERLGHYSWSKPAKALQEILSSF